MNIKTYINDNMAALQSKILCKMISGDGHITIDEILNIVVPKQEKTELKTIYQDENVHYVETVKSNVGTLEKMINNKRIKQAKELIPELMNIKDIEKVDEQYQIMYDGLIGNNLNGAIKLQFISHYKNLLTKIEQEEIMYSV